MEAGYAVGGRMAESLLYHDGLAPGWSKDYPRIQIFTIAELLGGKGIDRPPRDVTYKEAPKAESKRAKRTELGL